MHLHNRGQTRGLIDAARANRGGASPARRVHASPSEHSALATNVEEVCTACHAAASAAHELRSCSPSHGRVPAVSDRDVHSRKHSRRVAVSGILSDRAMQATQGDGAASDGTPEAASSVVPEGLPPEPEPEPVARVESLFESRGVSLEVMERLVEVAEILTRCRRVLLADGSTAIQLPWCATDTHILVQRRQINPSTHRIVREHDILPIDQVVATVPAAVGDRVLLSTAEPPMTGTVTGVGERTCTLVECSVPSL